MTPEHLARWREILERHDVDCLSLQMCCGIAGAAKEMLVALTEREREIERLRTDNQNLGQGRTGWPVVIGLQQEVIALRAQREALVEALELLRDHHNPPFPLASCMCQKISDAALAVGKGEG